MTGAAGGFGVTVESYDVATLAGPVGSPGGVVGRAVEVSA
jgi:hypothetical protein